MAPFLRCKRRDLAREKGSPNADQRRDLLEIVDDRCDRGSLLITSQVPVSSWHDVIGDPTLGDAILDRVLHTAHRIELKGESLRRKAPAAKSPA